MNTARSNFAEEESRIPCQVASPFLSPFPEIKDLDDDIEVFRVLDRSYYMPDHSSLPQKRHPVMDEDRIDVSASLLRRIEYELKNNECDLRTVFTSCRGLARGSLQFEDAYIKARIKSFNRYQRKASDPQLSIPFNARNSALNSRLPAMKMQISIPHNPMAVYHLGHLMSHMGIWVMALLGIQVWASWRIGAMANTYLEGGRLFYAAIALLLILALDSAVWFRRRGNLCDAFLMPGAVLFLMSLIPILSLHLREILLATR